MRGVDIVHAKQVRPQYWRVQLECGHIQDVHSTRDGGPVYVLRCQTCDPGKARRFKPRTKADDA